MYTSKPKVFISSTIHDFKDLRSALKYWLEQLGYRVFLSEYNDFTKPLNENSYKACLRAVIQADYYILFIGTRVGGFYNSADSVSITRMEYRTAYELVKSKKLKMVIFVREELWKLREDRKALKSFLESDLATSKELSPADIQKIVNHRSELVNNADAIFGFIEEVTRLNEMKNAIAGRGSFPIGNWVHTYSGFQDVVDVLKIELGIDDKLSKLALIENLKHELCSNLIQLTQKYKDKIIPSYQWTLAARQHLKQDIDGSSQIPGRCLKRLIIYILESGGAYRLSTRFIDQALISGEFLNYNPELNTYQSGLVNDALFKLRENIDRFRLIHQSLREELIAFTTKYKSLSKTEKDVAVSNKDLLVPLALADCEQNIVALTVALVKAQGGDLTLLSELKLNPTSPFPIEAKKIRSETPDLEDIIKWVNEQ
jgi:hypothetical protein